MDEDAAKRGPFGVRIAHGLLTLSIASGLLLRIDRGCFLPACTVGLYGIDRVRYLAPVRIGDRIHVTGEMRAVRPQQRSRVVLTWRCQIVRHDAEVAAVLDLLILCDPEVATR